MSSQEKIEIVEKMEEDEKENQGQLILTRVKKGYSYEWNKLLLEYEPPYIFHDTVLYLENEFIFDMWSNNFDNEKNIHFNVFKNESQIHYEHEEKCIPFILRFENINGVVERSGSDNDRNHYFKPTALIQTSLIYDIFAQFTDKICSELKVEYNNVVDNVRFQINCSQKLPINRVLYFRNLIVCFEKVEKIFYRRRYQHHLIVRIIHGEVLLNKK